MAHRIDIELTSQTGDLWTWRAAGARQPKGTVSSDLLYEGARVGDVVRADLERELDGVRLVSVVPPRAAGKPKDQTVEVVGRVVDGPSVNVQLAERGRTGRRDGREGGRGERRDGGARPERGARPPRSDRPERSERPDRGERAERSRPDDRSTSRPDRGPRPDRNPAAGDRNGPRTRPGAKRLTPGRTHRSALLDTLPVEQRPIAEQLFRGGIPAVRQAIIDQNVALRAAGQTEVPSGPLLALAEQLLPRTKQADWLDHATAALKVADEITLRDLRAVVVQADGVARDDESRAMAANLRDALNRRVEGTRTAWAGEINAAIADNKLVRAVRLAAKLPDPAAKLDPELVQRLVTATGQGLAADVPQDRWLALLEAAEEAPFRRDVVPAGIPEKASEALLTAAAQASNRIPALLKLLGLTIPPPPRPKAPAPVSAGARRPVPPPPPLASAAAPAPAPPPGGPAAEATTNDDETVVVVPAVTDEANPAG